MDTCHVVLHSSNNWNKYYEKTVLEIHENDILASAIYFIFLINCDVIVKFGFHFAVRTI